MSIEETPHFGHQERALSAQAQDEQAFLFVVDGPKLEMQSHLLATSLARAHRNMPWLRAFAYVSAQSMPHLGPATLAIYEAAGVEIRALPLPGRTWARSYPHGNKILACAEPREVARSTFLDTDMVVSRPLDDLNSFGRDKVLAVPEGVPTWGADGRWERAYAFLDLPLPEERVNLMRGSRKPHLPYFNAGFVSFPEQPLEGQGKRFADLWLQIASDFDHGCAIAGKRPWLDQITLPLTLYRHGLPWEALPETWNYSLPRRKAVYPAELEARVLHYHQLKLMREKPILAELVDWIRDCLPPHLHGTLDQYFVPETEPLTELG